MDKRHVIAINVENKRSGLWPSWTPINSWTERLRNCILKKKAVHSTYETLLMLLVELSLGFI